MMILDSREATASSELLRALEREFKDVTTARLRHGDLLAQLDNGIALIERKTANDFLASIGDGRVFEQVRGMCELARFVFVVIYGSIEFTQNGKTIVDNRITGWNEWSVTIALVALQAAGAIVVQTDAGGYVEAVKHLLAWCEKADSKWTKRKSVHWLPLDAKRNFLAQLPGVGPERVDALVEFFGDRPLVELLHRASTPSKQLPRLWGNGTINKVREFLGLEGTQHIQIRKRTE